MKRDMDFIRDLLFRIENGEKEFVGAAKAGTGQSSTPEAEKLGEHLRLLKQAGYIDVQAESITGLVILTGLSWKGHDFLDSVRDLDRWKKTKQGADAVKSWSLDTFNDIAKGLVKKQIEEWTGVKL